MVALWLHRLMKINLKYGLDKRLNNGIGRQLVSHGLRALASTTLNEEGFEADVVEAALAHIDKNAIRAVYNRSDYLAKRKEMMQWWSTHIEVSAQGNMSLSGMKKISAL